MGLALALCPPVATRAQEAETRGFLARLLQPGGIFAPARPNATPGAPPSAAALNAPIRPPAPQIRVRPGKVPGRSRFGRSHHERRAENCLRFVHPGGIPILLLQGLRDRFPEGSVRSGARLAQWSLRLDAMTKDLPSATITLESLRNNDLLRGCHADGLARIAPLVARVEAAPQTVIFREGEVADAMYLVLAGAVRLTRHRPGLEGSLKVLASIPAGEFFGDMALLDHLPHVAQAITAEPSVLGRIDRPDFEEILRLAPHVVPLNVVRAAHRRVTGPHAHFTEEIMRDGRLQHVGRMAGAIIHDFNTPLTTIRCACDLLETRTHDETHRRMAEVIKQSVERMLSMVQELLDYTLGGNAPLRIERVPLARLLAGLDEQALDDLPRHGITVQRQIDYQGDVEVDLGRFERVLLNIVKNAKEAMGKHGGRLRLAVYPRGQWLIFEIEDTGKGMPPEVAAKIFEPFFTHGKPTGTGLGMSMAKSVVDAHRGLIGVESRPGHGTKFEVKLPLQPAGDEGR